MPRRPPRPGHIAAGPEVPPALRAQLEAARASGLMVSEHDLGQIAAGRRVGQLSLAQGMGYIIGETLAQAFPEITEDLVTSRMTDNVHHLRAGLPELRGDKDGSRCVLDFHIDTVGGTTKARLLSFAPHLIVLEGTERTLRNVSITDFIGWCGMVRPVWTHRVTQLLRPWVRQQLCDALLVEQASTDTFDSNTERGWVIGTAPCRRPGMEGTLRARVRLDAYRLKLNAEMYVKPTNVLAVANRDIPMVGCGEPFNQFLEEVRKWV